VELRRVGKSYRGPCPIHGGEGPNLSILPERGLFYCFVCGAGGDGIELWQQVRGVSFVDAVRGLAA
jgi:DNA primase